jgi:hypothetical protein
MNRENFGIVQNLVRFDKSELNEEQIVHLFQDLLNTGYILQLERKYHKIAKDLVDKGLVVVK